MPSWKERIEKARSQKGFTALDVLEANTWGTCVVGEYVPGLSFICGPADNQLNELGRSFPDAVEANLFEEAERIRVAVLQRVEYLKNKGITHENEVPA